MAKTRRKKINKSPTKLFQNSEVRIVEQGFGIKTAGYRAKGKQIAAKGEGVKPVFVGRQYTGVPRGKTYPYAGKKRNGDIYAALANEITMRKGKTVAVVE